MTTNNSMTYIDIFWALVIAVMAIVIVNLFNFIRSKVLSYVETRQIIDFLKNSDQKFRSTEAIASKLNLSKIRVEELASNSKRIKRNERKKILVPSLGISKYSGFISK